MTIHSIRPVTREVRNTEIARGITDGEIVLAAIDVSVAPERVFRAMFSAECELWWGAPGIYSTEQWRADVREHGRWSLVTRLPDGTALPSSGEFLEVSPTKVVQSRRYDFPHPTLAGKRTRVVTLLEPIASGTRVVVRHDGFPSQETAVEHAGGWERYLEWLGSYLASGAEAAR